MRFSTKNTLSTANKICIEKLNFFDVTITLSLTQSVMHAPPPVAAPQFYPPKLRIFSSDSSMFPKRIRKLEQTLGSWTGAR